MFEAALAAWIVALLGDATIKGLRKGLLGSPESQALARALGVALAATLNSVPDASREIVVTVLRDRFIEPPAYKLDGRTRVRTGLIRAIHEQIAPLSDRSLTPGGRSFLEENGVDPAELRDELSTVVVRSIEQVGPSSPALTGLVNQLNADAILESVEHAVEAFGATKRQAGTGAVSRRQGNAAEWPASAGPHDPDADWVERLTDALLDVPAVADENSRQAVLELLPDRFRHAIPRTQYPRVQVIRILRTSANFAGGLSALVRAIRIVEGDSLPMERLDKLILSLAHSEHGSLAGSGDNA